MQRGFEDVVLVTSDILATLSCPEIGLHNSKQHGKIFQDLQK